MNIPLVVNSSVVETMKDEAESWWPRETGGIVLGTQLADHIEIRIATSPGPNAKHGLASFLRDGVFAQQELDRCLQQSAGAIDYVGEWHSHPLPLGPSPRDRTSMAVIASSPAYNLAEPLLLLCLPARIIPAREWQVQAFRFVAPELEKCGISVL